MAARVLVVLVLSAVLCCAEKCPEEADDIRSENRGSERVTVRFENHAERDLQVIWVTSEGAEVKRGVFLDGETYSMDSFPGHVFHFRVHKTESLIWRYRVPRTSPTGNILVPRCDGLAPVSWMDANKHRWAEFEQLVNDHSAPCVGPSSNWSCVRHVTPEQLALRDPTEYGFHAEELQNIPYKAGQTADDLFMWQQGLIVNVTDYEGGYLKMDMTDAMKEILYPWYQQRMKDSLRPHEVIPGGFTNNAKVKFDKIELNRNVPVRQKVIQEMKAVLEWWTQMKLRHTQTFGVRVYRRDSMLLNHLDRHATHIASAVIQLGQKVDSDGGWPLEVIHPHQPGVKEVYLQPGQMVLYEGARIVHGRPMRFRGDEFGNIFVHFAPLDWNGVDASRNRFNPHFKQEL